MKNIAALILLTLLGAQDPQALDLATLEKSGELKSAEIVGGKATLSGDKWGFLRTPGDYDNVEIETTLNIQEPARQFGYFGQHWSVWPDLSYPDQGFDAAILLRADKDHGYRVQFSSSLQQVALVKYRNGGYLRSVACAIKLKEAHKVSVVLQSSRITVRVDGVAKMSYPDTLLALSKGRLGIGVSSGAKVAFEKLTVKPLPPGPAEVATPHVPNFSVRSWIGGKPWVFDGDEPIMMLVTAEQPYINSVKLRPGFKPLLSWNSFWDTSNQGAFPEGKVKSGDATVTGGGKTLTATWGADSLNGRFVQRMKMVVGWDEARSTYTYDVDSELEVLAGAPFTFRYGYDFEHHTPLDPFNWQYLVVRREGGQINRRPVYPVDPGGMDNVEQSGGARVWYGRHNEPMVVAPAVEYNLPDAGKRKMNTSVCGAFYDTGVALGFETAPAGTKVRVKYRYTGWPAEESEKFFKASTTYEIPMLDPQHHYIFSDEWPKLTFGQFVPMSDTWIYGRHPFMTGHNQRPSYTLEKNVGVGSGFAMRLGPDAFGAADLPIPSPLPEGKYAVTALCKVVNAHGPGGRIELKAKDKNGKVLRQETHFVGNGTFDWKKIGFVSDVPGGATALSVGFGNGGTGDVYFTEVEFKKIDGDAPPLQSAAAPPKLDPAPAGAVFDYRFAEQKGLHTYDYARGPFGTLELANADWTVDEGRPALKFADPASGRRDVVRMGPIERNYLRTIKWSGTPVAIAGFHGGGFDLQAFTVSSWIKPAATMGAGAHANSGDIVGIGARRFILRLQGHQAPYPLQAAFNVNDRFQSTATVEADKWSHVAMTAEPTETKKWRVRIYLNGRKVAEGVTEKLEATGQVAPSLIFGSEIFYLHDSWYRGLIGRTMLLDHALTDVEITELAK
ncbi:MAG TPA: LamG-like jellyroll fold domain-containing protein [Planctomycetota bacterium]|nr:LamG-like jellyroll fold domain-containing protein [Planctomycetota bacterium]